MKGRKRVQVYSQLGVLTIRAIVGLMKFSEN